MKIFKGPDLLGQAGSRTENFYRHSFFISLFTFTPSFTTPKVGEFLDHQFVLTFPFERLRVMESEEDPVKKTQVVDARARNISHNVRCTECGSQSIEDSQADIAILLRKLIRDEIHAGKSDKEIYKKLEEDFGETVLYAPKFDVQTAGLWLSPLVVAGAAAGIWAYKKHRQRTNVHVMALNLIRGVPLTPNEKQTMLDLLTPPSSRGNIPSSWWRWREQ